VVQQDQWRVAAAPLAGVTVGVVDAVRGPHHLVRQPGVRTAPVRGAGSLVCADLRHVDTSLSVLFPARGPDRPAGALQGGFARRTASSERLLHVTACRATLRLRSKFDEHRHPEGAEASLPPAVLRSPLRGLA
jgi:hypothetical protein